MADTKISDLAAVTDVLATDEYVLARSGATKKIDASNLLVASEVAFTPTGTVAATDVQAAIAEVAIEAAVGTNEIDYVQFTSDVTISATTEGTANTVVTGSSVSYNGSTTVIVEFFTPQLSANSTSSTGIVILQDSTVLGIAFSASTTDDPTVVMRRVTPSAGSHTFTIKAYRTTANNIIRAGAGGSGALLPGFIRVYRV